MFLCHLQNPVTQCPLYERWNIAMSSTSAFLKILFPPSLGQPRSARCGSRCDSARCGSRCDSARCRSHCDLGMRFPYLQGTPFATSGPVGLGSQFRVALGFGRSPMSSAYHSSCFGVTSWYHWATLSYSTGSPPSQARPWWGSRSNSPFCFPFVPHEIQS